jgi:predicted nicotinamide N-methyase
VLRDAQLVAVECVVEVGTLSGLATSACSLALAAAAVDVDGLP